MIFERSAQFTILLLSILSVREICGAKCTYSFSNGAAVCNNVNSFREVALEVRTTWINVQINNRLAGTFAMVLSGNIFIKIRNNQPTLKQFIQNYF